MAINATTTVSGLLSAARTSFTGLPPIWWNLARAVVAQRLCARFPRTEPRL
jgi:hypothetical protein